MACLEGRMVDGLRGVRRMRATARKLPCLFWFLLLFGAGGLVLFIHLQDLSEMAQQQEPGGNLRGTPRQSRETLSTRDREANVRADSGQDQRPPADSLSNPIPPMQFPAFERARQVATPGSLEQEMEMSSVVNSSSSSSSSLPQESWQRLSGVQDARRRLMKEVCAKYKSNISRTITPHHVSRIYVEDRYKLLYCEVPKAGCSNWKRILMVLAGLASSTHQIKHDAVHYGNHLKTLDTFNREGIAQRLETYTKVLFVREPLERLVSAFRDKFENPNNYYHPVFGIPIITKYRVNPSKEALRTGSGVTFQEFMQYLLDVHRPIGMDTHWAPASQLCSPCLLDYDFIGKSESMEEEANFLLRRIGAPGNLTLPNFKDRNPKAERTSTHITHQYFAQLSALERQRAYDFYYMDYLMFNYSKPFTDLY